MTGLEAAAAEAGREGRQRSRAVGGPRSRDGARGLGVLLRKEEWS